MAIQTKIKLYNFGTSSNSGEVLPKITKDINFEFDNIDGLDDTYYIKKNGESDYVGFRSIGSSSSRPTLVCKNTYYAFSKTMGLYNNVSNVNGYVLVSSAWTDDVLTITTMNGENIPNAIQPSNSSDYKGFLGAYIYKTKYNDEDTWVAGFLTYDTNLSYGVNNEIGILNVCYDDTLGSIGNESINGYGAGIVLNTACGAMSAIPLIGRGSVPPSNKVLLINNLTEPYTNCAGYVTIGSKEYYRNGLFLIDPD